MNYAPLLTVFALLAGSPQDAAAPAFEAASIKPLDSSTGPFHFTVLPNRLDVKNMSLAYLIEQAYDVPSYQFSGPTWLTERHFDVAATSGAAVSGSQMRAMLQTLLRDRFHLATHWDTRTEPIVRLTVLPGGPKMKTAAAGYAIQNSPMKDGASLSLSGPMSMRQLCESLTRFAFAGKPVIDETHLEGYFTIVLTFADESPNPIADAGTPAPLIPKAVENQLGLKLTADKGPVKILVVDHADQVPTEN